MPESKPRRLILELITAAPGVGGITEQRLLAQGANGSHLNDLVNEGLVLATSDWPPMSLSSHANVVLTLTDAGRSALAS